MCTCFISDWPSSKAYWGMKKIITHNAFFLGTRLETEMGMYSENRSLESQAIILEVKAQQTQCEDTIPCLTSCEKHIKLKPSQCSSP